MKGHLAGKSYAFVYLLVRNLLLIIYILCNPNVFLEVCNFPYYRHISGSYGQRVLEKFPVNSALCHVYKECFIVNVYCRYM